MVTVCVFTYVGGVDGDRNEAGSISSRERDEMDRLEAKPRSSRTSGRCIIERSINKKVDCWQFDCYTHRRSTIPKNWHSIVIKGASIMQDLS